MSVERTERAALTRVIVDRVLETGGAVLELPADEWRREVVAGVRICLDWERDHRHGAAAGAEHHQRWQTAATGWAEAGIAIETVLHGVHRGFGAGLQWVHTGQRHGGTGELHAGTTAMVELLGMVSAAVDRVLEQLARAGGVAMTAVVLTVAADEVPAAARRAHELLDIAVRLGREPGVYRLADLALQYQLTRPGPGRDRLAEPLAALAGHPELLHTLHVYLAYEQRRAQTAKVLRLHPNSLDHRLRRIAQLTGVSPVDAAGVWLLRSALVAHLSGGPESTGSTG